jgi:hypothetical protein
MSESKKKRTRKPPTNPAFKAVKHVSSWDKLKHTTLTPPKKPTVIDEILADLEKKKVDAMEYNLNVNAYTGVVRASKAKNPRLEVKVLGSTGVGVDRLFQVAIRRVKD